MWKFTDEGHLENKLRSWSYSGTVTEIVPKDSSEGYIEIKEINKVITLDPQKNVISFENMDINDIENQKWKLGSKDSEGWRTIQHSSSGLYLTTSYIGKGTSMTVENKGRLNMI